MEDDHFEPILMGDMDLGEDKEEEVPQDENWVNPYHLRSNSTSTIFVQNTISYPNVDDLIETLAIAMKTMIDKNLKNGYKNDPFDMFYLTKYDQNERVSHPTTTEISKLITNIYNIGKLASETVVMSLVYLERLESKSKLRLSPLNWKILLLQGK
eukprot:TRINITY_DN1567_c0_g1_i2.p1 TRINITY_DN1567_c0_g1~~TRINITY_DN1567_c0_g1_i2.p1  ORF type:complete len:169 (-),score=44.73 TRINITY_DN1567_c0_g1_i2:636-1100(-)